MATPGIPNGLTLSTSSFGSRLASIQDQIFAAVGMGFRNIELGLSDSPPNMDGLVDSRRETGVAITSLVAGCRDPLNSGPAASRLASPVASERERALNSVRRHVRLARSWQCPVIVIRSSKMENGKLTERVADVRRQTAEDGMSPELAEEIRGLVHEVEKAGQKQVEHLCRSLFTLMDEEPEIRFAIEPGQDIDDLLGLEAMGWVMDDLGPKGLGYWHDVGRVHLREKHGLPSQGDWLDAFGGRTLGVHIQDAALDESSMPVGLGDVDFAALAEVLPKDATRVLEIDSQHGRAEILSSVQCLVDNGF